MQHTLIITRLVFFDRPLSDSDISTACLAVVIKGWIPLFGLSCNISCSQCLPRVPYSNPFIRFLWQTSLKKTKIFNGWVLSVTFQTKRKFMTCSLNRAKAGCRLTSPPNKCPLSLVSRLSPVPFILFTLCNCSSPLQKMLLILSLTWSHAIIVLHYIVGFSEEFDRQDPAENVQHTSNQQICSTISFSEVHQRLLRPKLRRKHFLSFIAFHRRYVEFIDIFFCIKLWWICAMWIEHATSFGAPTEPLSQITMLLLKEDKDYLALWWSFCLIL